MCCAGLELMEVSSNLTEPFCDSVNYIGGEFQGMWSRKQAVLGICWSGAGWSSLRGLGTWGQPKCWLPLGLGCPGHHRCKRSFFCSTGASRTQWAPRGTWIPGSFCESFLQLHPHLLNVPQPQKNEFNFYLLPPSEVIF